MDIESVCDYRVELFRRKLCLLKCSKNLDKSFNAFMRFSWCCKDTIRKYNEKFLIFSYKTFVCQI